ncbi:cysteine-rich receptor-like protein kinase 10 isoform X2 [Aristolochia californica]|uniref:cysteine-rich receptor-like protein kinase 10 isoform X2 n=1 Tax=Aristolochia californica TaxID=171875 RepID=UPI0035DBDD8B
MCKKCIDRCTREISTLCPRRRVASAWYDKCRLRYSDHNFSSTVDYSNKYVSGSNEYITDPDRFYMKLVQMMNELASAAASDPSRFATKAVDVNGTSKIFGLVQCTPTLSRGNCYRCLQQQISELRVCCDGKVGGRILGGDCNLRHELYQFYDSRRTLPSTISAPSRTKGWRIKATILAVTISLLTAFAIICMLGYALYWWKRLGKDNQANSSELPVIDLQIIQTATNNFSDANKLGQGGFGPVYKGTLPDGKIVAVKRLGRNSGQGMEEFKNEVKLIVKLQHRNLVRLWGCCLEKDEKLLVYEYMPNTSLDALLFDPAKRGELGWQRRLHIINGIARGLVYLHEDSRLRIIHRDLKASNVLLDHEMNAKISDFGLARIFGGDETEANTSRVVGTYGYMAPEYAMAGLFSVKSDVYSFGVLLLEILSGKRTSSCYFSGHLSGLHTLAWSLWSEDRGLELLDPVIAESCSPVEASRCIHIGLLCVQEDPADRPTMSTVVLMLGSETMSLPNPRQPGFCAGKVIPEPHRLSWASAAYSVNEVTISDVEPR